MASTGRAMNRSNDPQLSQSQPMATKHPSVPINSGNGGPNGGQPMSLSLVSVSGAVRDVSKDRPNAFPWISSNVAKLIDTVMTAIAPKPIKPAANTPVLSPNGQHRRDMAAGDSKRYIQTRDWVQKVTPTDGYHRRYDESRPQQRPPLLPRPQHPTKTNEWPNAVPFDVSAERERIDTNRRYYRNRIFGPKPTPTVTGDQSSNQLWHSSKRMQHGVFITGQSHQLPPKPPNYNQSNTGHLNDKPVVDKSLSDKQMDGPSEWVPKVAANQNRRFGQRDILKEALRERNASKKAVKNDSIIATITTATTTTTTSTEKKVIVPTADPPIDVNNLKAISSTEPSIMANKTNTSPSQVNAINSMMNERRRRIIMSKNKIIIKVNFDSDSDTDDSDDQSSYHTCDEYFSN